MDHRSIFAGAATLAMLSGCNHTLPVPETARTHGPGFELPILALSAAGQHVCAIGFADPVQCMFIDGEETTVMGVPGTEGAIDVEITEERGCALFGSGRVTCFGWDGIGPAGARLVVGIDDAFELAVGDSLVCGRTEEGVVRCASAGEPAEIVVGLEAAVEIAAEGDRACARTARGDVACWTASDPVARTAAGIHDATALAGGEGGIFATDSRGRLVALAPWGRAEWVFATVVAELPGAQDLAVSEVGVCGVTGRAEAVCWDAASGDVRVATRLDGTRELAMGSRFACGVSGDGDLRCAALGPDAARVRPRVAGR